LVAARRSRCVGGEPAVGRSRPRDARVQERLHDRAVGSLDRDLDDPVAVEAATSRPIPAASVGVWRWVRICPSGSTTHSALVSVAQSISTPGPAGCWRGGMVHVCLLAGGAGTGSSGAHWSALAGAQSCRHSARPGPPDPAELTLALPELPAVRVPPRAAVPGGDQNGTQCRGMHPLQVLAGLQHLGARCRSGVRHHEDGVAGGYQGRRVGNG
jgi:hypothetical protein